MKSIPATEVAGSVVSDRYVTDSISRINGYNQYWNFYTGKHFTVDYDGGDRKTAFNFCRKIVDKRANWVAGKGFSFYSDKGNELVSDVFDRVWRANNKRPLIRRTAKTTLCVGDAFWYFTVRTKDKKGKTLPTEQWRVAVHNINPSYCWPIYTEDDPSTMRAFMMQFPKWNGSKAGYSVFTAVMTDEKIELFENHERISSTDNVLGVIPVVHIASGVVADASFGRSAIEDVIPLNVSYNEVSLSVKKIIKYHGEPTTIVYGARLSQMERGHNKVWSNLPPPTDSRVENLEMKSDLGATYKYLEELEKQIYHLGKTPRIAYESDGLHISNTSGIAIQLLYQPLIEATIEEQDQYTTAIHRGNGIIACIHKNLLGEDLSDLADNPDTYMDMEVVWQSLLPKDEQLEVDLAEKKIAMGVWSKAEAARRLSDVKDTEKLALELAADQRHELAMVAEKARALNGVKPNYSAAMLSSLFLSEDLLDIASEIGELSDSKKTEEGDTADQPA